MEKELNMSTKLYIAGMVWVTLASVIVGMTAGPKTAAIVFAVLSIINIILLYKEE